MHPAAPATTPLRLDQMAAAVRRRPLTVVLVVLVWLALGAGAASLTKPTYEATAAVTVRPFDAGMSAAESASDMATEVEAATGSSVIAVVARKLNLDAAAVRDATGVSNPGTSRVIEIAFRAGSADRAADGANGVARAYLAAREERLRDRVDVAARSLEQRTQKLRALLAKSKPADEALRSSYAQQLATLESRIAELDLQGSAAAGEITAEANAPDAPSGAGLPAYLLGGLVLGLACAVAAACLRDRASRRVSDASLLSERLRAPVVTGAAHSSPDDITRALAFHLGITDRRAPFTLAVLGAPRSRLAAALAAQLRRQGEQVHDVDASSVSSRQIDLGWPRDAHPTSAVVVDLTETVDPEVAAMIARRSDMVVACVARRASVRRLEQILSLLTSTGRTLDAVVVVDAGHPLMARIPRSAQPAPPTPSSLTDTAEVPVYRGVDPVAVPTRAAAAAPSEAARVRPALDEPASAPPKHKKGGLPARARAPRRWGTTSPSRRGAPEDTWSSR